MLALAALTNVALALHLDPQLPEKLARRRAGRQSAGVAALEVHALQGPCFPQPLPCSKTSSILSLRRFRTFSLGCAEPSRRAGRRIQRQRQC